MGKNDSVSDYDVPKGYKLVPETKSARMQLLVRESTKEAVKLAADACGVSLNEMANRILDAWVDQQERENNVAK